MKYHINHEFVLISSQTATHRIILLHGWGADAEDLLPLGKEIAEKIDFDFEVISLRAPRLHPNNFGREWYGLYPHDWDGAKEEINKLVISLKKLDTDQIPLKKTILLGFSQGAAMAIDAGSKLDFGLIVSCSGYPHPSLFLEKKYPPCLVSHGLKDEVVPIEASRVIFDKLKKQSSNFCQLLEFDGYHQIDINLVDIINSKISDIF